MAAVLSVFASCNYVEPDVVIPAESQAVFASGISFDSGGSGEYQTATVRFTVTDRWRTQIHEIVTKAPFWLAVNPSSGIGGDVEMLQDLILAAVNEGGRIARESMEREMTAISGGIKLPGLF